MCRRRSCTSVTFGFSDWLISWLKGYSLKHEAFLMLAHKKCPTIGFTIPVNIRSVSIAAAGFIWNRMRGYRYLTDHSRVPQTTLLTISRLIHGRRCGSRLTQSYRKNLKFRIDFKRYDNEVGIDEAPMRKSAISWIIGVVLCRPNICKFFQAEDVLHVKALSILLGCSRTSNK